MSGREAPKEAGAGVKQHAVGARLLGGLLLGSSLGGLRWSHGGDWGGSRETSGFVFRLSFFVDRREPTTEFSEAIFLAG